MATASSISPSGMQLAGKYGIGVLSIASNSDAGIQSLPTQWGFAEEAAAQHGRVVDRRNWRVLMSWHLAETREQARAEAVHGLQRWHNEYNVWTLGRPGATHVDDAWALLDQVTAAGASGSGAAVVGTPDDLIAAIRSLQDLTGGFGVVLGFAHDWASREATFRSWELFARYVVPEINGMTARLRDSQQFLHDHQAELMAGAGRAVMSKIMAHEGAAKAMAETMEQAKRRADEIADSAAGSDEGNTAARQTEFRPGAGVPTPE